MWIYWHAEIIGNKAREEKLTFVVDHPEKLFFARKTTKRSHQFYKLSFLEDAIDKSLRRRKRFLFIQFVTLIKNANDVFLLDFNDRRCKKTFTRQIDYRGGSEAAWAELSYEEWSSWMIYRPVVLVKVLLLKVWVKENFMFVNWKICEQKHIYTCVRFNNFASRFYSWKSVKSWETKNKIVDLQINKDEKTVDNQTNFWSLPYS